MVLRYWAWKHWWLASLLPTFQGSHDLKKLFLPCISSPFSSLARSYEEYWAEKGYCLPFNHRMWHRTNGASDAVKVSWLWNWEGQWGRSSLDLFNPHGLCWDKCQLMTVTVDGFDVDTSKWGTGTNLLAHFVHVSIETFKSVHLSLLLSGIWVRENLHVFFSSLLMDSIIKIGVLISKSKNYWQNKCWASKIQAVASLLETGLIFLGFFWGGFAWSFLLPVFCLVVFLFGWVLKYKQCCALHNWVLFCLLLQNNIFKFPVVYLYF